MIQTDPLEAMLDATEEYLTYLYGTKPLDADFRLIQARIVTLACSVLVLRRGEHCVQHGGEIMRNRLPSEVNTPTQERKIRRALSALGNRGGTLEYEHGHWWLVQRDGSIFDVVDTGFDLERVSGPADS